MNTEHILKETSFILQKIDEVNKVKKSADRIKPYLIPLTLQGDIRQEDFYKITSLLTPQSRSPLWETYFREKYHFEKVLASENRGDMMKNGLYYEYKASGFNKDNGLHIVQIRLWQECDYVIQHITTDTVYSFSLQKEQMEDEVKLCKASSAHGTSLSNTHNTNIELRMTIQKESAHWKRWVQKYSYSP